MAEYFRKVTYLLEFKDHISQGNAGYGRLYFHEEMCHIQVKIKKESFSSRGQVYGCYLEGKTLFLVYIGELREEEGSMVYEEERERLGIEKVRNIIVMESETHYLAERSLSGLHVVYEEKESNEFAAAECLMQEEQDEMIEDEMEEESDKWYEKLMDKKEDMYPFEDDEIEKCVKLEPDDLMMLPAREWALAKNSFLLQGAYSYRHIIFVVREEENTDHYYIGVPGVFHKRDRFMAGMFGFPYFKGVRKKEERLGDFGYWLREIRK